MNCESEPIACQLARIADMLSGFDTNGFLATLLATVVGALVATGSSLWLVNRERPVPIWRAETDFPSAPGAAGVPTRVFVPVRLLNVGDGSAYNVEAYVRNDASTDGPVTVATVAPGASLQTGIEAEMTGSVDYDPGTGNSTDDRGVQFPSSAALLVRWQQPPRRRRVRKQLLKLNAPKN